MWYQVTSYLKFLWRSTNQHGVHSPFVFDLVTKCLYDKKPISAYSNLRSYQKMLSNNKEKIHVTDFGAGSRVFKSNHRAIAAIAKTAGQPLSRQKLLYRLAAYFRPADVLELGTSLGLSTAALALGNPMANIDTVEGCPQTANIAKGMFNTFDFQNIKVHQQDFDSFFTSDKYRENYHMVFIDGNHSKRQTLAHFDSLRKGSTNDTLLIFDDIYWSAEMTEAWKEIIAHPDVTVSIDTFYWGLVFFRKEQQKEHFTIRL